jgi:hypothetical protein
MLMKNLLYMFLFLAPASVYAVPGNLPSKIITQKNCPALLSQNANLCPEDDSDCKAVITSNPNACITKECKALASGNTDLCESIDCIAVIKGNRLDCVGETCNNLAQDTCTTKLQPNH